MKITLQDLIKKYACKEGKKWFKKNFREETDIETLKNKLIEQKEWDYLEWLYISFNLTGEYIEFYDNKKTKRKYHYKDGKLHGKYVWFYENGRVWEKFFCKNGKREGKTIIFDEDGKVREKGFYKDGRREGEYIEFYEDGKVKKCFYKDGERIR